MPVCVGERMMIRIWFDCPVEHSVVCKEPDLGIYCVWEVIDVQKEEGRA